MKKIRFLILTFIIFLTTACSFSPQSKLENNSWLYVIQLDEKPLEYKVVFKENIASFTVNQSQLITQHYPQEAEEFEKVANYLSNEVGSFNFDLHYKVERDHLYLTSLKNDRSQQSYLMDFSDDRLYLYLLNEEGEEDTTLEPLILMAIESNEESSAATSTSDSEEGNH